uniref:Tubulin tyrosine ligase like 3 n=1 Tax=Vombatus ursinus TaxID=29139 RepID=A0A4X2KZA7_VOMUR
MEEWKDGRTGIGRQKKVFMIQGRYPVIRGILRRRGWVEKKIPHLTAAPTIHPPKGFDSFGSGDNDLPEDCDEDDDESQQPDPEDIDDIHDLMSRMVRNEVPYFIWTTRRDMIDCRFLCKEQMINHYARAGSFTTKVGLCLNLRNLPWFDEANADSFFPRCYRLGAEDEKQAFMGRMMPSSPTPAPHSLRLGNHPCLRNSLLCLVIVWVTLTLPDFLP